MTHQLAILDDYQGAALSRADWSSLDDTTVVAFAEHFTEAQLPDRLRGFDMVFAMRERTLFTRALIEQLPDLRLLISAGSRNAAIDVRAAHDHGVTVCGTSGLANGTPELVWGLVISWMRNLREEGHALRAGIWQATVGRDLDGATLGLLGLGSVGSAVARVGLAFGMRVISWSQHLDPDHARTLGVEPVERDELFRQSDVLSVHVRLSARTHGIVGARELALMKPSALLVNTSRGPVVDEVALVAALRSSEIAGAALDVFDVEPLPDDHPLRDVPNVVLTPHLGYVTERAYAIFFRDAVDIARAYLSGSPIRLMDPADGMTFDED